MAKELARLRKLDEQYGLQMADFAENLEDKFNKQKEENQLLLYEVDGIPRKREQIKSVPIISSGGLYLRFGVNKIQEQITKHNLCLVQNCPKK